MKLSTYKQLLRKSLNRLSSSYQFLTDSDKEFYLLCAGMSYTVVEPVIGTDVDILHRLDELVKFYDC